MKLFFFALRLLRRDARAGELYGLLAALVIAVAALSAVGFFTDRVRQALEREASQMLGADLLLIADHAWSPEVANAARAQGLRVAQTRSFPSMIMAAGKAQLSEIKAVSEGYPLRGNLRIARQLHAPDAPSLGVPPAGEVWVDERLAAAVSLAVGDTLAVGRQSLRVGAILTQEPDRGVNFFSVAPRLLMNIDDLPATELIVPGSRVTYRLLLAGEPKNVATFRKSLEKTLARGERLEDVQNARPEIRSALERAQKFLGLSSLLTIILAAVAVALAARRYLRRHLDACAVMRCLGATQSTLLTLYLAQFTVLGLLSVTLGGLLGYAAHFVLHAFLAPLLAVALPSPSALPALQGVLVGFLLLFGFALPPLLQLKRVSTLRVLRREFSEQGVPPARLLSGYLLGLAGLVALMLWIAGEWRLGAYVAAGFASALVLFALLARLFVRLMASLRGKNRDRSHNLGLGWRYGLANLERRWVASVVQIVALALGFMALLLLTVTRNDLLDAWQRAIPATAANRFVINIQPDQLTAVQRAFADEKQIAEFSPMIRARLSQVNGEPITPTRYADERAKRLVEREFNLSYRADLPSGNRVVAGRWFDARDVAQAGASVEEGLAKTLGLKLGDELLFSIAGEPVSMKIVGLRKLDWGSMRVNFFVLTPPAVLQNYPASWITSFHLAPESAAFVDRLVKEFPNLTVIDVAAIVRQLQSIMQQVAQAVQFVFLFTLLAGFIVLYTALALAAEERRYELAVLRALGARREQLRHTLLAEFAAMGGLAGLIAALGALAVGQVLARSAFQFNVPINYVLPIFATLGGALLVTAVGWFSAARLIKTSPLEALRAG